MEISHTKVRVKSDRKLERFLGVFLLQFNCDELIEWKKFIKVKLLVVINNYSCLALKIKF